MHRYYIKLLRDFSCNRYYNWRKHYACRDMELCLRYTMAAPAGRLFSVKACGKINMRAVARTGGLARNGYC